MQTLSWNEQCCPSTLDEFGLVHGHIVGRLKHLPPFSESIIFSGPTGSGKTVIVNCLINDWITSLGPSQQYSIFRVTVDNINQWTNYVAKFSHHSDVKALLVFDGVWTMSEQDQQYLASVVESNRVCVLISTSVTSGWFTCLRSQLLEVEVDLLDEGESDYLATRVLKRMNTNITERDRKIVISKSRGNIFWLIHGLQAASLGCSPDKHGDDDIRETSNLILECIIKRKWNKCREYCVKLWETGWSTNEVIHYLYEDIKNPSHNYSEQSLVLLTEKIANLTTIGWGSMGVVKPMDSFVSLIGKVASLYQALK
uniref:Replication factor C clamp loader n=1 Tax=Clandestinovirus TaxID=2831644 RepID=A0A8F8KL13_9VIRU|nr:replication factor C clamp loader [Clandestinovirus]